jgi:transcription initiation factor TFIIIB Brf1 subunit/transcription initiation factor TFIIB
MKVDLAALHGRLTADRVETRFRDDADKLTQLCRRLELPVLIEEHSKQLYVRVKRANLAIQRCKHGEALLPALVYVACRARAVSRTLKEISAATQVLGSHVTRKSIGRCYLAVSSSLALKFEVAPASGYITRFAATLGLAVPIAEAARFTADRTDALGLAEGRCPVTIAAASLYMVCSANPGTRCALSQVAAASMMSVGAVREVYAEVLRPAREQLFPEAFREQNGIRLDDLPA